MARLLGCTLFFLMLAFPMVLALLYVKAAMFAALLAVLLVRWAIGRPLVIDSRMVVGTLAFAAVNLFFSLEGFMRGAPGAAQCAQVYVFWPLVYSFLIASIDDEKVFSSLERTMIFATAFIGVFGVLFFLSALGVVPAPPFADALLSKDEMGAGFLSGHVELAFPGLNSLPFLLPFVLTVAVTREQKRLWPSVALLATLPLVILSGRRALQLVTMLSPLMAYAIGSVQPRVARTLISRRVFRVALAAVLLVSTLVPVLSYFSDISVEGLGQRFSAGFDFSNSMDESASARTEQYLALTKSIMERPLFGSGLGAANHGSVRSETMPWAYELYYVALIFQVGLVGFAVYALGMLWIYRTAIRLIRHGHSQLLFPAMAGMTGLLIATATNPYLVRFDGLWAIFLPLALINHYLVRGAPSKTQVGDNASPGI